MAHYLKQGRDAAARADADRKVRETVEGILADVQARGDAAIRDLSQKFDDWDRESFRLSPAEIEACDRQVTPRDLEDIASPRRRSATSPSTSARA